MASFDSELDALFKSSAGSSAPSKPVPTIPANLQASSSAPTKRKHEKKVGFTDQNGAKRRKPNGLENQVKKKKAKQDAGSSEEDDPAVEDAYHQRQAKTTPTKPQNTKFSPPKSKAKTAAEKPDADSQSESGSDSDSDAPPPLHESLTQKPGDERPRKKKYVPEGETPEQRDARTIFIGNLPASVAKSSSRKSLQKHVLKCLTTSHPDLPRPKIESCRFRSIAFKTPTSKLPSDALSNKPKPENSSSEHNKARAAEWRAAQDPEGATPKIFQTSGQKKKTAYITGALHDSAKSSATAYVVFAHPVPEEGSEPAWDPKEVAARAVSACNGSTFMDRVLRVDRVGKREEDKPDPRTMVFVGNLDFEVDENAVRELFEKLVEKERGKPDDQEGGSDSESAEEEAEDGEESGSGEEASEDEGNDKKVGEEESEAEEKDKPGPTKVTPTQSNSVATKAWVKSVRIIRDKDTQLGKGFGYVQFIDRASADEILAMEPGTIKLAKRKLRIQRCKTVPGVSLQKSKTASRGDKTKDSKKTPEGGPSSKPDRQKARTIKSAPVIPRADPALGERIRSLSKDERKSVKASDADRVARRLAKKKAKVVSERGARKETSKSKASILGGRPNGPKSNKPKPGKSGKRERSDKALLKKNIKK